MAFVYIKHISCRYKKKISELLREFRDAMGKYIGSKYP